MAAQVQFATAPGSHIEGWMTEGELRWLCETAAKMQSVAEIGCWKGRSTYALCASGCPRVYAIDHFQGSAEHNALIAQGGSPLLAFLGNLREFIGGTLQVWECSSEHAAAGLPAVDMVFIDGSHDQASVERDIWLWRPKVRKLIAGHDFFADGVTRAVLHAFAYGTVPIVVNETIWSVEVTP